MTDEHPAFVPLAWSPVPASWRTQMTFMPDTRCCTVALDRETRTFQHLLGRQVLLEGAPYVCWLVEGVQHAPPWHPGEVITLVVSPSWLRRAEEMQEGRERDG